MNALQDMPKRHHYDWFMGSIRQPQMPVLHSQVDSENREVPITDKRTDNETPPGSACGCGDMGTQRDGNQGLGGAEGSGLRAGGE